MNTNHLGPQAIIYRLVVLNSEVSRDTSHIYESCNELDESSRVSTYTYYYIMLRIKQSGGIILIGKNVTMPVRNRSSRTSLDRRRLYMLIPYHTTPTLRWTLQTIHVWHQLLYQTWAAHNQKVLHWCVSVFSFWGALLTIVIADIINVQTYGLTIVGWHDIDCKCDFFP